MDGYDGQAVRKILHKKCHACSLAERKIFKEVICDSFGSASLQLHEIME